MIKIFIIIAITATLLLFPIPIKITLKYINKNLEIYLYKFKIMPKNKIKKRNEQKPSEINASEPKKNKSFNYTFNDIKGLISRINNNKLKPNLKFKLYLNYGLGDAANTAISYGYLNCFNVLLYNLLKILFKVAKIEINIIPNFENAQVHLENTSIIFINLVNILSIMFIFISFVFTSKHNKHKNNKQNCKVAL